MSVLIKGGRIITASDDYIGDVYAEGETVSLIGESLDVQADKVIDAAGKYVLPGAIDPHTHIEMFFGGTTTCDDFTSGTVAAAFGGTTSLVDFCMQAPGTPFPEALDNYFEKIERCKPVIDVGFHIGVTDIEGGGGLDALAKLPDEGVTSYKLFMAYKGAVMVDDETLFKTMEVARETGGLVMVHAENGDAIDVIVKKAVAEGKTDPIWHARTRPMETEAEATNRAIQLARVAGCSLYVVHVSCLACDRADRARAREGLGRLGRDVHAVPLRRRERAGEGRLGGRQVHLHAAAAPEGAPGAPVEGPRHGRPLGRLHRPLPLQLAGAEGDQRARVREGARTAARASRTASTCCTTSASATAASR